MGVANIPDHKDQRAGDEWNSLSPIRKMDVKGATEEFVTVVSVGSQPPENFVTVLSIGSGKKEDETLTKCQTNGIDGHLEEEVEVFRLPGERLGFGLKFEGGNKTSERVRRLFVQSCAEQSPASRAKCSWGTLGEGDEVLSIDGVPVTHMTRLDCVRRLKESQLVIRLMVRCRGALRPEVVSAERKSPEKSKVPPELPSAPPPVPPRKLRQPRGSADGDANPSPVKKWDSRSPSGSQNSSQNGSPSSHPVDSKSTSFESCESSPKVTTSCQESPKGSPKERSPELTKSKQEPPEAMVYLDARSQSGSTHGSTSDDTGSSMSTVVDRFSTSDRVSTISTASTASTTSEQPSDFSRSDQDFERSSDRELSRAICPFDEYSTSPPDYLLRRLASSEAVTHVESRGEIERITAVVAPNTVLIEETITFQPPLSFQDAPLSYGHEARPDLFYAADLAADSTTHFRPIKDDAELVERVNGDHEEFHKDKPPPLPARNHVNRISVNQVNEVPEKVSEVNESPEKKMEETDLPVLPPKPLPRKDVKVRRKRPPPPPPPPTIAPRREVKQQIQESKQSMEKEDEESISKKEESVDVRARSESAKVLEKKNTEDLEVSASVENNEKSRKEEFDEDGTENPDTVVEVYKTNKVLEIIEIRKARAQSAQKKTKTISSEEDNEIAGRSRCDNDNERGSDVDSERIKVEVIVNNERTRPDPVKPGITISTDLEDSDEETGERVGNSRDARFDDPQRKTSGRDEISNSNEIYRSTNETFPRRRNADDESYRSLDEINEDLNNQRVNRDDDPTIDEDDTTDESDEGDYYWQSNLATIGEEEETNSLEYSNADKGPSDTESNTEQTPKADRPSPTKDVFTINVGTARNDEVDAANRITDFSDAEVKKLNTETVNGRMENCGGGQRLPPDGDEFPAAYQEFSSNQQYLFVTTRAPAATSGPSLVCESFDYKVNTRILPENRVTNETCQEAKVGSQNAEMNGKIESKEANLQRESLDDGKQYVTEDFKERNTSYSGYGGNGNVVVSEKKIEITGYYHKEVPTMEDGQGHGEKESMADTPPPLPLTGPPKIDGTGLQARNVPTSEQPQRKFSLNGDLWRQDDKSERSVRDKIAMFSSQSNLHNPLFPNTVTVTVTTATVTNVGRRLSKYKSSEDVCVDEKSPAQKERASFFADRTQSSFDLTDSGRTVNQDTGRKYGQRSPSLTHSSPVNSPLPTIHTSKTFPIVPQKPTTSISTPLISSFEKQSGSKSPTKCYSNTLQPNNSPQSPVATSNPTNSSLKPISTTLTRATSFSGSTPYCQDRNSITNDLPSGSQISRTNSLASTFRRPNEDIRRTSLNQLIEQRRRSISKLRGLVIPEKESMPIDQPIVDLPEIKSRDSILLQQMSKANIQDKWGSQSSLASNASTASMPLKATTSFKMPAPQIHSKYSPAFKRKSLTVYGSSTTSSSLNGSNGMQKNSQATTVCATTTISEPPKSLESICSPTRSDYSFEFMSMASPEGSRNRSKTIQRKSRVDYDDSDNDSAVSSSQSSISRGFSPPMSPVPSERSTVSSERSERSERSYISTETNYQRRSLIIDSPTRTYARDTTTEFGTKTNALGERTYLTETSSSSSSGSNSRSPQPVETSRNSQIPQRQLKRSNSTDTNCSTSSTLTSGSQASAESLSRRVLKPQSVEAINRKNILASARCRSGRELNGSPLIQRKFFDEDDHPVSTENGDNTHQRREANNKSGVATTQDVKIAYIEVTDSFVEDSEELKLPPKRSVPPPVARPPKSEMLEPSNDLKMWVRTEVKALIKSADEKSSKVEKPPVSTTNNRGVEVSTKIHSVTPTKPVLKDQVDSGVEASPSKHAGESDPGSPDSKQKSKPCVTVKKPSEDQTDLLTILTTKSRSRAAIHVDDGTFAGSKSQMSLEDILSAKADAKLSRVPSTDGKTEKNGVLPGAQNKPSWEPKDRETRYGRRSSINSNESWAEDRPTFVSKIPTIGRSRILDGDDDDAIEIEKTKNTLSKIPTPRNLGRRSASVTDMKKALEKMETNTNSQSNQQSTGTTHNRFPSLDSSVDENASLDAERCCSEQFGSISSLASSTSLISQQELAQLVEEASLEETRGAHDVIVVLLHKENPTGSVGITLAGGADCEVKEITVHRVLVHSIADKDGRVQRGDRILSINGRSTRGLTHKESLAVLKQPRSEIVLVVSRARLEEGCKLRSRTASVETIIEGFETNGIAEDTAWGPPSVVAVYKDGAGLGFSLEGGRDSPLGDRPLVIKKIFTGGAAEKTGALKAGDQLLEVNGNDVTRMSRIEAWSLMKKLHDGEVNLLVRHPATKSS